MLKTRVYYFSVSGFIFKLILSETPFFYEHWLLLKEIKRVFALRRQKYNQPIDCTISVTHRTTIQFKQDRQIFYSYWFHYHKPNVSVYYSISITQLCALISLIVQYLLPKNHGFLLHASTNIIGDKAYLFTGPSEIGKSTAANLLKKKYPKLTDDLVVIKKEESSYFCYASPYLEKDIIKKDAKRYEIGAIFYLQRLNKFSLRKITNKQKVMELLSEQLLTDKKSLAIQFKMFAKFIDQFDNFYFLSLVKDQKRFQQLIASHLKIV